MKDLSFNMDQEVYFFLNDSLEIIKGVVSGFFLSVNVDEKTGEETKVYNYQIEYEKEFYKDDDKKETEMKKLLACLTDEFIRTDKQEITDIFEPKRAGIIESQIKETKDKLNAVSTQRKFDQECEKELESEIKRLEGLNR